MKINIALIMSIISLYSYSQVGINTINPQGVFHIDGAGDNPSSGSPTVEQESNDVTVSVLGNIGVGTTSPNAKIELIGSTTVTPIIARNMEISSTTTLADKQSLFPVVIDNNGVMIRQASPVSLGNSYSLDGAFNILIGGGPVTVFTGINNNTVVVFKFATNLSFGNGNTGMLYGQISFSVKRGFRVSNDWVFSGDAVTEQYSLVGENTNTLVFNATTQPRLTFAYSSGIISVNSSATIAQTNVFIYEGRKIR
ncbi:hypothetical protein G7050_08995 [Dysgonomonas sp. HDW5A]|uniref:hypothetical protein n=1 Tax=Dysgonomonas sp. HDW5A TaxID=2714926 RepID=UPI00140E4280|nr:hypothetical protein [Dysgonomonas sp. HDW5A]QIK59958.1 hypothetical protein G7050_08995 [Dysgonomonas sp. HDW5A]